MQSPLGWMKMTEGMSGVQAGYLIYALLFFLVAGLFCIARSIVLRSCRPLVTLLLMPACGLGLLSVFRHISGDMAVLPPLLQWLVLLGAPPACLFASIEVAVLLLPDRQDPSG